MSPQQMRWNLQRLNRTYLALGQDIKDHTEMFIYPSELIARRREIRNQIVTLQSGLRADRKERV